MIRTPPGWGVHVVTRAVQSLTTHRADAVWQAERAAMLPAVRRIDGGDLRWALERGWEDFKASRTDIVFLCIVYPLVGLLLARLMSGHNLLPLVFPLAAGFALIGPLAAVGLNDMSRRRELGLSAGLLDALAVFRSPSFLSIVMLGFTLVMLMVVWLTLSQVVYSLTLGPAPPVSLSSFVHETIHTGAGRTMAVVGIGAGFVFAVIALTISVVSFPMLLDRTVSVDTAVRTSVKAMRRNPVTLSVWGLIIAVGLLVGSIPALLGLVVVMPVLGHATWHLYRRMVPR